MGELFNSISFMFSNKLCNKTFYIWILFFYHRFVIFKLYLNDLKIKSHLHNEVYCFWNYQNDQNLKLNYVNTFKSLIF